MKKLLLICLLLPVISQAQEKELQAIILGRSSDSTAKYISLPSLDKCNPDVLKEMRSYSSYKHMVDNDSLYYRLFLAYSKDSLPVFDFTKQELVVYLSCVYCMRLNPGTGWENDVPRHRNACDDMSTWFVRNKKAVSH